MLNLGIRAHDMGMLSLEELTTELAKKNIKAVQLAIGKSFPYWNVGPGGLTTGLGTHIKNAFDNKNIKIAVMGCYINMIHPEEDARRKEIEKFKEYIRYASDFGCKIVGTETGTLNVTSGYTEDNFAEAPFLTAVESVKELVKEAEKFGVIVGVEGGVNHPVNTIEKMKRLIDLVDSNNLQVIFDPANYLTIENYLQQEELMEEAFALFGEKIVILHMKDFAIENNTLKLVGVGMGKLNYNKLFEITKTRKPHMFCLLEGTTGEQIDKAIEFVTKTYCETK